MEKELFAAILHDALAPHAKARGVGGVTLADAIGSLLAPEPSNDPEPGSGKADGADAGSGDSGASGAGPVGLG